MEENIERHSARLGFYAFTFYEIVLESLNSFNAYAQELHILKSKGKVTYETEIDGEKVTTSCYHDMSLVIELESKMRKETIKCVIFIATFLEAYIWDLSATVLGDSHTQKHLDRKDIITKWKMIPKLVTGKELTMREETIYQFRKLIKIRNSFVHNKTRDYSAVMEAVRENRESPPEDLLDEIDINASVNIVNDLFHALNEIDPAGCHLQRLNWFSTSGRNENEG